MPNTTKSMIQSFFHKTGPKVNQVVYTSALSSLPNMNMLAQMFFFQDLGNKVSCNFSEKGHKSLRQTEKKNKKYRSASFVNYPSYKYIGPRSLMILEKSITHNLFTAD